MSTLKGTVRLTRLAARRDRVQLPIWIAGTAMLLYAGAAAVADEFPSQAARATALHTAGSSPAVLVMRGIPVSASEGGLVNFRNFAFTLLLAGLMSTFMVVRHTRQNEESGRAELVGAGSVGRYASLAAALTLTTMANVVLGAVLTATLLGAGLPAAGSVAFGAACAVTGIAFAGIAAVAAQLFTTARAANAFAASCVGVAFMVRGIGDALGEQAADGIRVTSNWLSWLSPLGWGLQVRPFGDERWWVLALPLVAFAGCVVAAFALVGRRDLGAGLVAARLGPAVAARSLLSPTGLAWRLQRGSVLGWVIGSAVFGVGIGALGDMVNQGLGDNKGVADLMAQLAGTGAPDIGDVYYAGMMNIFGVLAAGFAVQALLRLRSEETGGQAEAVLATATGRVPWVASHLACAVGGAAAVLLAAGAGAGIADAAVGGDAGVGTLIGAGLVQLPAALAVAGFAVLAFGWLPRLAVALAWAGFGVSVVCGVLGEIFGLPQSIRDLSPFSHVPAIPAADPTAGPILALVAAAAALTVAGMALFRRRDLTA